MGVTCMEVDTDREKQLERPLKRRCLRDPIETHTSLQNGALESAPQRTDGVDSSEDDEYLNFLETYHDNYGSVPSKAYRYGSSSGSDDLVDPQYKIFFESLRVTRKSYELEVQVDVGTSILLKYDIEDQPHEGLNLEYLKSRTLKNTAETMKSLRNAVGREKDKVVAVRRKENDKEKRIPRNLSGREESLQTIKAAATSKGNCNLDKRNIEAQPADLGCNQAIKRFPGVLCPKVQQAPKHEEETCNESYPALLNSAKDDGNIPEFISDNGKQTTNAATTNKGNCNFDKRKMEARPTNLGSHQAIRQSPRVLRPEFQKAPEHEEHTCNESYLALLNGAKNVSYILESKSDNGKQNTKAAAASKRNCSLDKRTIDAQPTNLGSTQATRWSPKVLRPEVQQAPEHEEETWDESYLAVLSCAKEDGSIIEFTSANGKQTTNAATTNKGNCNFDKRKMEARPSNLGSNQAIRQSPRITVDSKHFADDPGSSSGTVFRKKLMGVLKMPYDVKEHEDLSRRVRHKRQKTVEKSLRQGRDFTSSLRQRCKSYLELHKDLATELKLVRADRPRNLNLLRGFFFWLENVPQEGAFKPWLDPSCLKVLPAQAIRRV
ncbi:hypothetical protein ACJRO7_026125 [Eucalyptus globulus]|uniref:Uncharacterized protein n=1 Tax=Eucalyptus globulus TaxID=34317 RepID=A0ABD3KBQ4_EUCGL